MKCRGKLMMNHDERIMCKICGTEETENPDGICDDYRFCISNDKTIPPGFYSGNHDESN